MKTTTSKAMSLKGNIKNLAKEKKVPPQIILQNFMFERFLQRLSLSEYRNNFIIKGGVPIKENLYTRDITFPVLINSLRTLLNNPEAD